AVLKIQASTVSVLTSSELLLSGIDTAVLLPLKASAEPFFPVVQDGLVTVPVLPCPDASATVAPAPSLNAKEATGGAGGPPVGGVVALTGPASEDAPPAL